MDPELLAQLLGGQQNNQLGEQFFSLPPDARLETLRQRQSGAARQGEELDPVSASLLGLLERRVPREQVNRPGATAQPPTTPSRSSFLDQLLRLNPFNTINETLQPTPTQR